MSVIVGIGKKKAWKRGMYDCILVSPFCLPPPNILVTTIVQEKYVILLYDKTCQKTARQHLFTHQSRALENIPPTQAALKQRKLRTALQAGHVW
ncbi:hypothetical protein MAR_009908, partial [Mya arenaria]